MKTLFQLCSPGGRRGRLTVLIFHRVLPVADPLFPDEVDAARFDEQLGWLRSWFNVLPLDEAVRRLADGSLPPRAAALSFDDGYADNHDVALPLLRRHGLPCSFFIATRFLDGGRMWNDSLIETVRGCATTELDLRGLADSQGADLGLVDVKNLAARRLAVRQLLGRIKYLEPEQRQACVDRIAERAAVTLPGDLMMSSAQVKALHAAGMCIGAHTVSHPILATLQPTQAADEIARSRTALQALTGVPVTLFAYPNGKPRQDYLPEVHPGLVRELGFEAAVSTHWGAAGAGTDRFQVPRFTPWDRSKRGFGSRLLRQLVKRPPAP